MTIDADEAEVMVEEEVGGRDPPDDLGGAAGGQGGHGHDGFNATQSLIPTILEFLQSYGWFILIAVIVAYYIKKKVQERTRPSSQEGLQYDADTAFTRQEAMEQARRKMQQEYEAKAAVVAEQKKLREEQKRQERIEDWDRHQEGKGYRSKVKPKEDQASGSDSLPKPKKSKPLRPPDYSPLMGDGGASCSWRPGRRAGGGGGG